MITMFQLLSWNGFAQISTSLQQQNFETCDEALPQGELILGDLTLTEGQITDFAAGTYTFFIQAPSNFEINASTTAITGTDITSATVGQVSGDATKLEIILTVGAETSLDALVLENVSLQLISGTVTDGELNYVLDGNQNNLTGLSDNDTLATLSFTALNHGTGVDQEVCALQDLQNISITGATVTQSRTYEWL